jgi:peptidoglycan-associated lipoprotein
MQSRSLVSGGALILMGMALMFGGCSKKQPVVSEASTQDASAKMREEEEAARRAREAAIAERERRAQEESMRRSAAQMGMTRDEFVNQDVLFAFDDYTLSDSAKSILDKKASWMRDNGSAAVKIEGHCDERGTTAYNLALGERRANAAKQYLSALGISGARMSTVSYGEQFPLDPGHTESAWVRNRRAHFTLGQ